MRLNLNALSKMHEHSALLQQGIVDALSSSKLCTANVAIFQDNSFAEPALAITIQNFPLYFSKFDGRFVFFFKLFQREAFTSLEPLLTQSLSRLLHDETSFFVADPWLDTAGKQDTTGKQNACLYMWSPFDQANESGWFDIWGWATAVAAFYQACYRLTDQLNLETAESIGAPISAQSLIFE